jgi:transcriptional regulator with XRE-family HTH domain
LPTHLIHCSVMEHKVGGAGTEPSQLTAELVARLRDLRRSQGMPAREVASRCAALGVPSLSRSTIAKIESGVRGFVTVEEAAALAMALGVAPADLFRPGGAAPIGQAWNVPPRNPGFAGREGLLATIREALLGRDRAVVQAHTVEALHGMGGVGKTQVALEYAHRFADEYDLISWIAAEQSGLIAEQFAALAGRLGCAPPDPGLMTAGRAAVAELRRRDRWLLVFDNAEKPEDVAGWLPGGTGHVLITSRTRGWAEIAVPVEVDVLARTDSVAILRDRVSGLPAEDADRLAEALGDLPLALVQAAAFMAETGMTEREYTSLLTARATAILDQGRPTSYPRSLTAVTQLAFDRLRGQDEAAADVAGICAFLAPEPIPLKWFTSDPARLPTAVAEITADPVAWRQLLARISQHALARIGSNGLQMHRCTQAIVRAHLPEAKSRAIQIQAAALLAANSPSDPQAPRRWPQWAQLLPHLIALDPAATNDQDLRELACEAAWYLVRRGDARSGHQLARSLYEQWRDRLGPDDCHTLKAAAALGVAAREIGRYGEAHQLNEDTLGRRRRVLGEDHPDTLTSANSLAVDLYTTGNPQAARELHEDTLARRRRVLGEDHPDTLWSATSLADDLRALGEAAQARQLDEETLARRRRVLGDDHPHTLTSAAHLADDLRALGEAAQARQLDEETLAWRRRVLGDDHPDTLASAAHLAGGTRVGAEN